MILRISICAVCAHRKGMNAPFQHGGPLHLSVLPREGTGQRGTAALGYHGLYHVPRPPQPRFPPRPLSRQAELPAAVKKRKWVQRGQGQLHLQSGSSGTQAGGAQSTAHWRVLAVPQGPPHGGRTKKPQVQGQPPAPFISFISKAI